MLGADWGLHARHDRLGKQGIYKSVALKEQILRLEDSGFVKAQGPSTPVFWRLGYMSPTNNLGTLERLLTTVPVLWENRPTSHQELDPDRAGSGSPVHMCPGLQSSSFQPNDTMCFYPATCH